MQTKNIHRQSPQAIWIKVISSSIRRARGWKVDARFPGLYRPLRQAFIRLTGGPGLQPWTLNYPRRRPLRAPVGLRQFFTGSGQGLRPGGQIHSDFSGRLQGDIDFERRIIMVRRSAPKWLVVEKSPKSNRHRRVDMTPELAEALERIRHIGETVFCNADGSKLRPGQFHEILWAAQKKAGLRRIKWHELRHSFASILRTGGAPLRVVQSLVTRQGDGATSRQDHGAR